MSHTLTKHKFYTTLLATGITFLVNCPLYASEEKEKENENEEIYTSGSTEQFCLNDFPDEILLQIFNELPDHDKVKTLPLISSRCRIIQQDNQLWKSIVEKRFDSSFMAAALQYSPTLQMLYNNGQAPQWREIIKNLVKIRNEIYYGGISPRVTESGRKGRAAETDQGISILIEGAIKLGSEEAKSAKITALKLGYWGYPQDSSKAKELEKLWDMVPPSRYNK